MARLIRTDLEVAAIQRQLQAAGHATIAQGLGALWSRARGRLWPLLNRQSRLEELRAQVLAWLEDIDTAARQAAAAVPEAMRATVEHIRDRLRTIWTEGVDWVRATVDELAAAAQQAAGAGAGVLFLVGLAFLFSSSRRR